MSEDSGHIDSASSATEAITNSGSLDRPAASDRRPCVLWVGGQPGDDLVATVAGRGWHLRSVSVEQVLSATPLHDARALLIEISDHQVERGDREAVINATIPLIDAALSHGVLVALVPAASEGSMTPAALNRVQAFCYVAEPLKQSADARVTYWMREWGPIIGWIAGYPPGPGMSLLLQLEGDRPTEHELEAETLLRRAFHDSEHLTLTHIAGGKSGAAVWSAETHASDMQHRASPFLVKYNTLDKVRTEWSRYAQYADEGVSFRLRPPLHRARCVEGRKHGLLVFDFIERAVSFRAALTTYAPGQLVGSLFGHTLAGCLRHARDVTGRLEPAYRRIKGLNWSEALEEAAWVARSSDASLPDSARLRRVFESLPPMPHRVATAHGDLHTGNLLVASGSSDVLLIDFGSIEFGMPVATDPACLEVSITFAPEEARRELGGRTAPSADAEWLRGAYRFPLDPFAVPHRYGKESWVAEAVRAIRGVARQLESSTAPFAIATASYLIRFASYCENGSAADRALAYELAARLVLAVGAHAGADTEMEQLSRSSEATVSA